MSFEVTGGWQWTGLNLYNEHKELIKKIQNMLGYIFVVTKAQLNSDGTNGKLKLNYVNKGVAANTFPSMAKLAFTDADGKTFDIVNGSIRIDIGKCLSGVEYSMTFDFKLAIKSKESYIAVGLFEEGDEETPTIRFGNKEQLSHIR